MEQFDALLSNVIDSTLGLRSRTFGYQYSEILRSLMCVFFCGGSCSEDIVDMVKAHCKHFYIRANRCSAFYDDMFILRGWRTEEINGIEYELSTTSRIKTFVFKFISVPAKWIKTSGEYRLNIYTVNPAYARVFNASD